MENENLLLIALYGAGTAATLIAASVTVVRASRIRKNALTEAPACCKLKSDDASDAVEPRQSIMDLPGRIFTDLLPFHNFLLEHSDKPSRIEEIEGIQSKLSLMSQNVSAYVQHNFGVSSQYKEADRILLQNIAVCLYTFLDQVKNEKRLTSLNDQYPDAVKNLINSINSYFGQAIELDAFVDKVIQHKHELYFSLYTNVANFDPNTTKRFLDDFRRSEGQLTRLDSLAAYLNRLRNCWIRNDNTIRAINPVFIMPLLTAKNILSHCQDSFSKDRSRTLRTLQHIEQMLKGEEDPYFRELCYFGLSYSKKVVSRIYSQYFEALKRAE